MKVILKPGKEKPIKHNHHWIFSGAIAHFPDNFENGTFLPVYSSSDELLGSAYFNSRSNIIGRMVSFDDTPPLEEIQKKLLQAISLRKALFANEKTTMYRLVNGEGDALPGLTLDRYGNLLVIQISTLGMELLRDWLIQFLIENLKPVAIYEKSNMPSRKSEGLQPYEKWVYGVAQKEITCDENGLEFIVSPETGQKTGFFLDQREMRQLTRQLSYKKKVLNAFSYTGGFSVYAAAGQAKSVDSVDISESAIKIAERNMQLNNFQENHNFIVADVFSFLREKPLDYDLVILDPPAFAKQQKDIVPACRGYKDINRLALSKMPSNALLLTCSCSYYVDAALFQKVLFQAASEANRTVRIIGSHRMASDHPVNIFHPEGSYLKSFLLHII